MSEHCISMSDACLSPSRYASLWESGFNGLSLDGDEHEMKNVIDRVNKVRNIFIIM